MDRQQTSVNRYIINWALMVVASFTWLCIFPVPFGLLTGIPALQNDFYLKLLASLAFANKIALVSTLVHIYIRRNLAFLKTPLLKIAIEAVLNLQMLIVLLAVVSGLTYGFDPSLKSEKDISDGQFAHGAFYMIGGIALTNSLLILRDILMVNLSKGVRRAHGQAAFVTMELGSLSLERDNLPDAHEIIKAREISNGVLTNASSAGLCAAETPGPHDENRDQDKWRFTYHDEMIFYFGYCISLPEHYQDYVGPP